MGSEPSLRSTLVGFALGLCLLLWLPVLARADAAEARAHFQRGVGHTDRGEIDAAIEAFEAAYKASPHPAVLFNLGQAYSMAGRPLDAVRVLRSVVAEKSLGQEQRQEAEKLLSYNLTRVGVLVLKVLPPGASIYLDGRPLGKASEVGSLELAAGEHVVTAQAPGYRDGSQQLSIQPWVAREHRVELTLQAVPRLDDPRPARLVVVGAPRGASVRVDAQPYDGAELSSGPHWLEVSAPGHLTVQQRVDLKAGATLKVEVELEPRASQPRAEGPRRKRLAAYLSGGVGLAAAATALSLFLVNDGRAEEWKRTEWASPKKMVDEAVRIQRFDDATIGCAVAGGALLTTAVSLWLLARRDSASSHSRTLVLTPLSPSRIRW